jgi:hypothetical protein
VCRLGRDPDEVERVVVWTLAAGLQRARAAFSGRGEARTRLEAVHATPNQGRAAA